MLGLKPRLINFIHSIMNPRIYDEHRLDEAALAISMKLKEHVKIDEINKIMRRII